MAPNPPATGPELGPNLSEALARSLRHEFGDFLQKVYASIAILQSRLPAEWDLEREILNSLRKRAEACKNMLNAVQDFLCPVTLASQELELAGLIHSLVGIAQDRFRHVEITADTVPVRVVGDPERLTEIGQSLLANACEGDARRVRVRLRADPASGQAEWTVTDDGPGLAPDRAHHLFRPFFSTRPGHAGLGLALARKIVQLHRGEITAGNDAAGGFQVRITLPTVAAAATPLA